MKEEDLNQIKVVVSDTMSDFYHDVLQKRFNNINHELTELRITSEALVKNCKLCQAGSKSSGA